MKSKRAKKSKTRLVKKGERVYATVKMKAGDVQPAELIFGTKSEIVPSPSQAFEKFTLVERHTFDEWEWLKNPKETPALLTEAEYLAQKEDMEAKRKRDEELQKPPYYHFKEEFPEMVWEFGYGDENHPIGGFYRGIWFGLNNGILWPSVNEKILNFRCAPFAINKKSMDNCIDWYKNSYTNAVQEFNKWNNSYWRSFWRVVRGGKWTEIVEVPQVKE